MPYHTIPTVIIPYDMDTILYYAYCTNCGRFFASKGCLRVISSYTTAPMDHTSVYEKS